MPRRKPPPADAPTQATVSTDTAPKKGTKAPPADASVVLHPHLLVTLEQAGRLLGLARHTLPHAAKNGDLRVARRAGVYWTTGAWLMEWIRSGERRKEKKKATKAEAPAA